MTTLLLKLVAPIQSWGVGDWYYSRSTRSYPTRSGVIGLIHAALGIDRDDDEGVRLTSSLRLGVRLDHEGKMISDFQTITFLPVGATGKKAQEPITKPFTKHYISDAAFLVGVEGEHDLIEKVRAALIEPRYTLFLGRKSCPPSEPVLVGVRHLALGEALLTEPLLKPERHKADSKSVLLVTEDGVPTTSVRDHPVSFSKQHRTFDHREVREEMVVVPVVHPESGSKERVWHKPEFKKNEQRADTEDTSKAVIVISRKSRFAFDPIQEARA